MCTDPERCLESQVTANQFRQHKVKTNLSGWSCHISRQIMKSLLVICMSIASLQTSWASASLASKQVPHGVLRKIVQFMWHGNQQPVQVQCTFLLCHWNKQFVIVCHWRHTLEQYYIQIWYISMHRIFFGDVFKFYEFLFGLVYFIILVWNKACSTNFFFTTSSFSFKCLGVA